MAARLGRFRSSVASPIPVVFDRAKFVGGRCCSGYDNREGRSSEPSRWDKLLWRPGFVPSESEGGGMRRPRVLPLIAPMGIRGLLSVDAGRALFSDMAPRTARKGEMRPPAWCGGNNKQRRREGRSGGALWEISKPPAVPCSLVSSRPVPGCDILYLQDHSRWPFTSNLFFSSFLSGGPFTRSCRRSRDASCLPSACLPPRFFVSS